MKLLRSIIIQLVVTLVAIEIVFRLFGHVPYHIQKYSLVSEPNSYMLPDANKGFILGDGTFNVTINDSVKYTVTHKNGYRPTSFEIEDISSQKPKIALIGGSFNYGMGVDDTLSYPYILQKERFKNQYNISNYCMPGYGTYQSIYNFKTLENYKEHKAVILHYASFHDERNVLTPTYRVALHHGFLNSNEEIRQKYKVAKFPYYDIEKGETHAPMDKLYRNWWLREYSSAINFFQSIMDNADPSYNEYRKIPTKIIEDFNENICKPNGIHLIIATITSDEQTKKVTAFCENKGIKTVDLFVDYTQTELSNLPYDSHPNAKAHRIYAEKMYEYLK